MKVAQTKLKDLQIDSKSLKGLYNSSLQIHAVPQHPGVCLDGRELTSEKQ